MLRTIFLLLAVIVLIVIGLVATGFINLNREADGSLDVSTSDVKVGTATTNVQLPVVRMEERQVEAPSLVIEGGDNGNEAQANAQ